MFTYKVDILGPNVLRPDIYNYLLIVFFIVMGVWIARILRSFCTLTELCIAYSNNTVLMLEDVSHLEITEGVVPKDAIDSYFKKKRLEDFPPQAVETFYTPVYIHKNTFSTSIVSNDDLEQHKEEEKNIIPEEEEQLTKEELNNNPIYFNFKFKFDCKVPVNITLYWGVKKKEFKKFLKYHSNNSKSSEISSLIHKYASKMTPFLRFFTRRRQLEKQKADLLHEDTLINENEDEIETTNDSYENDSINFTPSDFVLKTPPQWFNSASSQSFELSTEQYIDLNSKFFQQKNEVLNLTIADAGDDTIAKEEIIKLLRPKYNRYHLLIIIQTSSAIADETHQKVEHNNENCTFIGVVEFEKSYSDSKVLSFIPKLKKQIVITPKRMMELWDIFGIEDDESETECVVCLTNPKNSTILPCHHHIVCTECSEKLDKCPLCRTKIYSFLREAKDKDKEEETIVEVPKFSINFNPFAPRNRPVEIEMETFSSNEEIQ